MSAQDTLKKTVDAFNRHDADAFAALYTTDAVAPDPQYAEPLQGREAIRKDIVDFFEAFPDIHARVIGEYLVNGDTAAVEVEMSGTHKGPLVSPAGPIPATNKPVRMPGARFIRVNPKGLITECRRYYDLAGVMQQLGLMG